MSTYARTTQSWPCDECGADMAFPLFCDNCGADYPERKRLSPFALLGFEAVFALDGDALEAQEMALTKRLHPDRWQQKGERLYKRALLAQSAANEALKAVRDAFQRGDTLLALQAETQEGLVPEGQPDQMFLVEQLELREEIEGGVEGARKRELTKQARGELRALKELLAAAFATAEQHGDDRVVALTTARDALDRSRYWRNIQRALRGEAPQ